MAHNRGLDVIIRLPAAGQKLFFINFRPETFARKTVMPPSGDQTPAALSESPCALKYLRCRCCRPTQVCRSPPVQSSVDDCAGAGLILDPSVFGVGRGSSGRAL